MTCREIEDLILESLETPHVADPAQAAVAAHVATCASCRAFQERQMTLDVALSTRYAAPEAAAGFEQALRRRIAADRRRVLWEYVPDLLHLGGGLAGSAVCAWFLPESAGPVIAIGAGFTLSAYFLQMLFRVLIEEVEEGS